MTVPRFKECTIWTKGEADPITGFPAASIPRVYKCSRRKGGRITFADTSGNEFYPKSTFWIRSGELVDGIHSEPTEGQYVALGNHIGVSDPSTVGAEEIKAVTVHDHEKFNQGDSYVVATG